MCRDCRYETKYIRLNDSMIAEVKVDTYDYDEYQKYSDEELKEKLELEVKSIYMTRGDFITNVVEAGQIW
jgi:hypothetical protein